MDAYESFMWILRIVVVIIVSIVLVLILAISIPRIEANDMRADILAGRVLYNGGFSDEPGVIDASLFTQQTIDKKMVFGSQDIAPFGMKVSAGTLDKEFSGAIIVNKPGYQKYSVLQGVGGVKKSVRILPVLIRMSNDELVPGVIAMEVYYEE